MKKKGQRKNVFNDAAIDYRPQKLAQNFKSTSFVKINALDSRVISGDVPSFLRSYNFD